MSLPVSQQRALDKIEMTLAVDHPGLGPLFAIFTRLTGHEAMPVTEQVSARSWAGRWPRRNWPTVITLAGLAVATGVLLTLSLMLPGSRACAPSTGIPVAARMRPVPTLGLAACTIQQNKPAETSQSTPQAH
jgi:hypothetical protein